jgi:hypothetical protein
MRSSLFIWYQTSTYDFKTILYGVTTMLKDSNLSTAIAPMAMEDMKTGVA